MSLTALPTINPTKTVSNDVVAFLDALKNSAFSGEMDVSYSSRMAVATDNSIYQKLPQAVVFPKNTQDIALIAQLANDSKISFGPRGGGTGTNGQSLTPGVVVDTSKHMREILELNVEEGWVRVQSGVIKDQLNDFLRPHGFFFSPDLSTSNRATIGGMISTDASGQGSLVYGKTSDHVLGIKSILSNGEVLDANEVSLEEAQSKAKESSFVGNIYRQVIETCVGKRKQILAKFPRLNRFLTGYDLEHAYDSDNQKINLARLIAGAEGSLAFISEAKLNLTRIPNHTVLVNVKYNDFESALRHAPSMIKANATSVETVDSKVLNLARADIVWHSVSHLITEVKDQPMDGLNMVEYNSDSKQEIDAKLAALKAMLDSQIESGEGGVIGYQITDSREDIKKIYGMRKKAVGLLGKSDSEQKPIAFAEDTAVPPENLADFIMEFRALLDQHGLKYGMFGHVDAGVLHVRPALNLCDPEQEKLVNIISDQVVALVAKYGGLMWGEHGKGYRSEYAPEFFGPELYDEICKIKAAFDPNNQLNPGKICVPYNSEHALVKVSDEKRATYDRQIPVQYKESFSAAMSCNGNGLCFNYDTSSPMCPSSKITKDRRHSPKGRAGLIREWLYQLSQDSSAPKDLDELSLQGIQGSASRQQAPDDFSHEVYDAMQGCLACKSCSNQCPINVDVPDFRSKFLAVYHTKYKRPFKDFLVSKVESLVPVFANIPRITNVLQNNPLSTSLMKSVVGYVDSPSFSSPSIHQRVKSLECEFDFDRLRQLEEADRQKYVLIVQDPFTSFYEAELVESAVVALKGLGFNPVVLPFHPNGKAQHVKGFLKAFKQTAQQTSTFLNDVHSLNIPMIGMDASLVLCYRDEYSKILGQERGNFKVHTITEWLSRQSFDVTFNWSQQYKLLTHCTEKTAIPTTEKLWQQIFENLGANIEPLSVGCCGMAGTYGHELDNLENSKGIYDLSWQQQIEKHQPQQLLVTGYSCRSQVKRFEGFKPKHPIEAIADAVKQ